jgi:pyridoxamine 5'-phosphate oxidase
MGEKIDQLKNDHHQFNKGHLIALGEKTQPFVLFQSWMDTVIAQKVPEANAFFLATSANKQVSSRIVYLKEIWNNGFVFYTNYQSQKAKEIELNPKVAMHFFWHASEQQIRIEGIAEKILPSMSDAYFATRPRESQLGAWASQQSEILTSRNELEERIQKYNRDFPNEVPRPPHWGGFVVYPQYFEFWQGMPNRIHDRLCFIKENDAWQHFRKNP